MPLYEFRCAAGHVTEALGTIGTAAVPCGQCPPISTPSGRIGLHYESATRILSPTRTTFVHADTSRLRQKPIE